MVLVDELNETGSVEILNKPITYDDIVKKSHEVTSNSEELSRSCERNVKK